MIDVESFMDFMEDGADFGSGYTLEIWQGQPPAVEPPIHNHITGCLILQLFRGSFIRRQLSRGEECNEGAHLGVGIVNERVNFFFFGARSVEISKGH